MITADGVKTLDDDSLGVELHLLFDHNLGVELQIFDDYWLRVESRIFDGHSLGVLQSHIFDGHSSGVELQVFEDHRLKVEFGDQSLVMVSNKLKVEFHCLRYPYYSLNNIDLL